MFADSPGLHGVEHPIYDVWLVDCKGGTTVIKETPPVNTATTDTGNPDAAGGADAQASPQVEPAPQPPKKKPKPKPPTVVAAPLPAPEGDNAPLDLGGGTSPGNARTR